MVLTRLSHFGEVCPLSDHSYSDPASPSTSTSQKRPQTLLGPTTCQDDGVVQITIFNLPNEILEKIFSYLSYKKVGEIRLTCKRFEQVGSSILSSTFQRLQNQMLQRFQTIKGQMPRRESARRLHPLARESDIVESLHMRLTLLQMSFGKHIERKHCCFFAGDILDEVYRLLWYINKTPNLDRAYIVTDELFDLSTMAMEYFKEHIEPRLPEIHCFGSDFLDMTSRFSEECSVRSPNGSMRSSEPEDELPEYEALPQSNMVLRKRIKRIRQGMRRYNTQLAAMKRELKSCKGKLADQHKQNLEYATRMDEYDKKFEETSRKFSTVLQELNKCKTELQYWRSKSPAQPVLCFGCGQSIGDGPAQQYQPGMMMQGGEDPPVYLPLAAAPAPECAEKVQQPQASITVREDERDRRHVAEDKLLLDIEPQSSQPQSPSTSSVQQQSPPPPLFQSISTCQINISPETSSSPSSSSSNTVSCPVATVSNNVPAPRPLPVSHSLVAVPAATTSLNSIGNCPVVMSAPYYPPTTSSFISQQPYSAFHSCVSSQSTDSRWYGSQEQAEDLSMSRANKHYLDDESYYSLKRRSSDDDSDNCDNDDTVGRRVKERKRIKLDV